MNRMLKASVLFVILAFVLLGTPPMDDWRPENLEYEVIADKEGNLGGGIKLSWGHPYMGGPPYGGCFRSRGSEDWLYIIEVDGLENDTIKETEYCLYTPCEEVRILAFDGEDTYGDADIDLGRTYINQITVYEINGAGKSGIGFDLESGDIGTYSMGTDANEDSIDCYFTNWAKIQSGFVGPYYLASPNLLINDPGDPTGGTTGWRTSEISRPLGDYIENITIIPAEGYSDLVEVVTNGTYGVLTQDGYYGLIQVIEIDETEGEIEIKATFQPIKGLRWMVTD